MKNHEWIILTIGIFFIGFILGSSVPSQYLKIKTEGIGLGELAGIIVTIWIGWYIPSKVSTILENRKAVKNLLVNEIYECLTFLKSIKEKLNECYKEGDITPNDKQEINLMFDEAELYISNLTTQIGKYDQDLCKNAIESYHVYWKSVTDGDFMNNDFDFTKDYLKTSVIQHYKMQICFKQLAQNLQSKVYKVN